MLETVLLGLLTQLLTRLSEKWKVSQTYIALGLSILLGVGYYVATTYYDVQRQQLLEVMGGVYASSQLFYNLAKKWGIIDKEAQK